MRQTGAWYVTYTANSQENILQGLYLRKQLQSSDTGGTGHPGVLARITSLVPCDQARVSLPASGGSTTWQIASYFCHMTLDTAPANSGAPSSSLRRPRGSATLPASAGRPVRPHLQPSPLPGCDALSARPSSSPLPPADWQLPAPILRHPGSGAGPHARVALSVQVEAPEGAKWQEPLKGRERRRARTRPGPARPGPRPVQPR